MSEAVSHPSSTLLLACSFYLFLHLPLPFKNFCTASPLVTTLHLQWSRLKLALSLFSCLSWQVHMVRQRGAMEAWQDCRRKTHLFPDCLVESSRWVLSLSLILLTSQREMIIPPYFPHKLGRWNRMTPEESFAEYTVMCMCFCSCKLTCLHTYLPFKDQGTPDGSSLTQGTDCHNRLLHPLQVLWSGWHCPILKMEIRLSVM